MTIIKHAGIIAWLIGIAVVIGLVIWSGIDSIAHAVVSVGWGILAVVGSRALQVAEEGPEALREYVASLRAALDAVAA